jgi:hypothetical protein
MSDDFLSRLREEPDPEYADRLGRRLREIDEARSRTSGALTRVRPLLAAALVAAVGAAAFLLPAVRATAREFLDLFRVQRVAAVPVDTERLQRLERSGVDLKSLVGGQVEVLEDPGQGEAVDSLAVASSLAGVDVRPATAPPRGATLAETRVSGPGAFRVRLDTEKLRSLVDLLGVEDATIPPEWEGATLEVHTPPLVAMRYHRDTDDDFLLVQSAGPEVALPEGVDLAELGALGLQMAGMSAEEARLFARRVDWRSTLLVPIPAEGSSFREVEVGDRKGLLVTGRAREKGEDGTVHPGRWHSVLLWADEDRVYAAMGPGHGVEVLEMALSVR